MPSANASLGNLAGFARKANEAAAALKNASIRPRIDILACSLRTDAELALEASINVGKAVADFEFSLSLDGRLKAGKSTVINGFAGNTFQPYAAQPETAVPITVVHSPKASPEGRLRILPLTGDAEIVEGVHAIRLRLEQLNDAARADHALALTYAGRLSLEVALPVMEGLDGGDSDRPRFCLEDLTGGGENGADLFIELADRIGKAANFQIFVLEYTKMNEKEAIEAMLKRRADRPDLFRYEPGASLPRLLVLLNKVDLFDESDGRSINPKDAPAYLRQKLSDATLDVPEECILPFSARLALQTRLVQLGRASAEEKARLFGPRLGPNWASLPQADLDAVVRAAMEESGQAEVERRVRALYLASEAELVASCADQLTSALDRAVRAGQELLLALLGKKETAEEGARAAREAREAVDAAIAAVEGGAAVAALASDEARRALLDGPARGWLNAVINAAAALVSGAEDLRAPARALLASAEAVARFDAACAEADAACGGEGGREEAATARQLALRRVADAYAADEFRRSAARAAVAALAARVGVEAPAVGAPDCAPVAKALASEAAKAGLPPHVAWGELVPPSRREWQESVVQQVPGTAPEEYEAMELQDVQVPRLVTETYNEPKTITEKHVAYGEGRRYWIVGPRDRYHYTTQRVEYEPKTRQVTQYVTEQRFVPVKKVREVPIMKNEVVQLQREAFAVDRRAVLLAAFPAPAAGPTSSSPPFDAARAKCRGALLATLASGAVLDACRAAVRGAALPALRALLAAAAGRAAAAEAELAAAGDDARALSDALAAASAASAGLKALAAAGTVQPCAARAAPAELARVPTTRAAA
eukprot:tig00020710_g13309.t1